jgi:CheY-like chemotaxis protein
MADLETEFRNISCRVLICDDNVALRKNLQTILEKRGCVVSCAGNGKNFWNIIGIFKPDIVLLDINLPDTTGIIIKNELRQKPCYKRLPIIFISSYIVKEKPYCYSLQKPFGSRDLLKMITYARNITRNSHNYL